MGLPQSAMIEWGLSGSRAVAWRCSRWASRLIIQALLRFTKASIRSRLAPSGALAWTSPLDVMRRLKFLTRFLAMTTGMGVPSGRDRKNVNCCVKSGPSDWGRAGMSTVRHVGPLKGCEINNAQRRQARCRCRASASRSCQSAWRACSGIRAFCWHRRGKWAPRHRPSRRRAR